MAAITLVGLDHLAREADGSNVPYRPQHADVAFCGFLEQKFGQTSKASFATQSYRRGKA
jgi:hypothetical protein